ncbi:Short-chain dehydrogenase [Pedobacter cryoconitis]|uniref:Short-chain dehydrogenase n=1 Tax=Pedobacter cryoconitis TaxID=188932 RepID=A0A127VFA0_9SPHI|nr:SDR family oxidoreductase [Pedobacter cryoconitis]AMP99989.1 Short-chain dehydrogenase [Pedobacter cryoconitis]
MNEYALITGASKGIGKAIAVSLARSGYHLLLVARSDSDLQLLSQSIEQQYKVKVHYLSADLSLNTSAVHLKEWCTGITSDLSILVNNAGYGLWADFEVLSLSEQLNMLRLNIDAVIELTYHLLPILRKQKQSYILNISSVAAYQAMSKLALYAASKSFILSYSRALRYELKDSPVTVSCLSPGPTATGFSSRAGMDALTELAEKFNMTPEKVAEAGLKGMFKKKAEIIPGFLNKVSVFSAWLLPKSLIERITASLYK